MKTNLVIKRRQNETQAEAEWRYFLDATLHGKYDPKSIVQAMSDKKNIESAKSILGKKVTPADVARKNYLNSDAYDKKIMRMVSDMSSDPGFMNMSAE